MWWWIAAALAVPPDGAPAEFELASGAVDRLQVSEDGRLIAGVANGTLHLLDTDDWSVQTAAPCTVAGVALEWFSDSAQFAWIGCDDGTVHEWLWEEGTLAAVEVEGTASTLEPDDGAVLGLWYWPDGGLVYVLTEGTEETGNAPRLHTIETESAAVDDESGFPVSLAFDGFADAAATTEHLILFHGGDDVSQLSWGSAQPLTNLNSPSAFSADDAAPSIRGTAYVAASQAVAEYQPSSFLYTAMITGLSGVDAVGASTVAEDEWLVVSADSGVSVYTLEQGALADGPDEPIHQFDPGIGLVDIVVARWSYAVAGTDNGRLLLLTANPWVADLAATPATAADGDTVTLSFSVDAAGDYEVLLGGDASGSGESIAEGSVEAGEVEVEVTVGDAWAEGINDVYVLVDDDGQVGHARAEVTVDNPPGKPSLSDDSVGFGNQALTVSWPGLPDEDLDHYVVYVTTTPFDPADWDTGGPDFDGNTALEAPITVPAEPGADPSVRIAPLDNQTTYYIAVRAYDAGGKEGPMSDVVQGTPQPTYSLAELAGDEGGHACNTTGAAVGWLGWMGVLALAAVRRRRTLAAGLVAVGLLASTSAQADEPRRDATPARGNFEIRYGVIDYWPTPDGPGVVDVYGEGGHDLLQIEAGGQFARFLEVDFGVGFYQDVARTTDETGEAESGEIAMLTWYPISLDASLRAHVIDEQFLVPFGRLGLDYVLWNEERETGQGARDKTAGGKAGWHYGFGIDILLDTFAPGRASLLEANTGINDTWVVIEWRRQIVEPGEFLWFENSEGLSFSGDMITAGLKLDF